MPAPTMVSEADLASLLADLQRLLDGPGADGTGPRERRRAWIERGPRYARIVVSPVADPARRSTHGFVDLTDGCLLRGEGERRPDPVPRGSLRADLDPGRGRRALGPDGVRHLSDPALDQEVLWDLRRRCAPGTITPGMRSRATGNTRVVYLYRDASNYKALEERVLGGPLTDRQIAEVRTLIARAAPRDAEGRHFLPTQIGLPPAQERMWERFAHNEDDHVWNEMETIERTAAPADPVLPTAAELLAALRRAAREGWDVAAAMDALGVD